LRDATLASIFRLTNRCGYLQDHHEHELPRTNSEHRACAQYEHSAEAFSQVLILEHCHSTQGEATRPYRFGEFDILAVALHPSTNDWANFRYTLSKWLVPDAKNNTLVYKYQAVPKAPNANWTDNLLECIEWFRNGRPRDMDLP
jgi:hypothetical protein